MILTWKDQASGATSPLASVRTWALLIGCVASRAYLGTLLGLLLWTLVPLAAGAHTSVVLSGSMMPSLHPGDAVVRTDTAAAELKPGHVVVVDDPDHPGRLRIHRLIEIRPDGLLVLRGDANKEADSTPVEPSAVRGLARLRIPYIALPAQWLHNGQLGFAGSWLLLTVAALILAPGRRRTGPSPDTGLEPPSDDHGSHDDDENEAATHQLPDGVPSSRVSASPPCGVWSRRSSGVALAVIGLLLSPLGNGVATAAYTTAVSNPTSAFAAASSFCTSPSTTTVSASADSTVNQGSPNANSGNARTLSVVSAAALNQRTLVNFALPTIPTRCTVTTAVLTLTANSGNTTRTLSVTPAPTAWSETTVTWNNQPAISGTASTATAVASGPLSFTVTTQLRAIYTGSNYGFTVQDQSESSLLTRTQTFSSKEGATTPKLTITYG
jgi:signal peptidase